MLSDVFAFLLNCCSSLFNFHNWCCEAVIEKIFSCIWTQFGVCTLSYLHEVFLCCFCFLAVHLLESFLFFLLFLSVHRIEFQPPNVRMLFAPTCRCTSVLFAMRMTLGRIGWSTTLSLCDGGILPADDPASTMTMTLHTLLLLLHHYYQYHLIHLSLHIHPCKITPVSLSHSLLLSSCRCCIHPFNLSVHLSSPVFFFASCPIRSNHHTTINPVPPHSLNTTDHDMFFLKVVVLVL